MLFRQITLLILTICTAGTVFGEAMLQYFNTSWAEITRKIPELAEAGYSSLWLPPPTKASGGLSVGYDLWDPFDLGGKDQRNTVRTRYGTEAELLELVRTAHRFGIRIYFDNIMNHRAFDVPGFNENTPIDIYPGLVPEDFHLRRTQEGFYRKWDNTRDWNSAWQVQNLGLADLIDISQEPGTLNFNHGYSEGSTWPKIKFIRDLDRPEQYAYDKDGNYVGFGGLLDIAEGLLNDEGNPSPTEQQIRDRAKVYLQANSAVYNEYVEDYLNRAARWLMDRTKADGLRLDAVKHVRADFYGATFGAGKDSSNYGYLGQVQEQFNLTRGFSDWDNHRDSVFDTEIPRDDAMVFGEHLGEPPGYGPYFDAGMRLVDNPLRTEFNSRLGNPSNGLNGFDNAGAGGFAPGLTVMHAQSHDSDYAARRELQHAMYFTRAGLGLLYTDGNYQAETLGESGGAFPRHSNTSFLGQWDDVRVPNLLYIHEQFARGYQQGKWSDDDVIIYERVDKRENGSMSDADGVTLLFMLNDNYSAGQGRTFDSSFLPGDFLYNYSSYGGGFYKYAWEIENGSTIIPAGGYFAFSWKNPDPSSLWAASGGRPLTIYQGDEEVETVEVIRRDGPNGDADFHGDTLPAESRPVIENPDSGDYTYTAYLPRITDGTDLRFVARVDGSAENVLIRLGGGIDLNGTRPASTNLGMDNLDPVNRDHPPALSWDMFLGYEQPNFLRRVHPELFAAVETSTRMQTGSAGAETYTTTGVAVSEQGAGNTFLDGDTATFIYHDPNTVVDGETFNQWDGSRIWAKSNDTGADYRVFLYYTPNGTTFPEGAAGEGQGATKAIELVYQAAQSSAGNYNWWATPALPVEFVAGTTKYKIGIFKENAPSWFPGSQPAVDRKTRMMSVYHVDGFDATAVEYFPHFDYAQDPQGNLLTTTGLDEGFHMLTARAFLDRVGKASVYNTFKQTFYYDIQRPQGEIRFPENNGDTVGGSGYGVVVRTDSTVTEVWYNIADSDATNDDSATGSRNGNGAGFEPFSDNDRDGVRDETEPYEDLNGNGQHDDDLTTSWVKATEVTPSLTTIPSDPSYTREWRFNYNNIPSTGTANIQVRLREVSSSGYEGFGLSDVNGHFTTLTRTVNTAGPDERVFVAFPPSDGQIVGDEYVMKVYFTKSLADGLLEQQLLDRFLIRIGSNKAGDVGNAQDRANYSIEYNVTGDYHALAYNLPNLYNDLPDYLHRITVDHDRPTGFSDFQAVRLVKALPVTTPRVLIVNPPELGSDGRPYEIVMPDVPTPTSDQRQFTLQVATNTDATNVGITFVNARGSTLSAPVSRVEGNSKLWDFTWTVVEEGAYRFTATVTAPGGTAEAARNTTVVFRQVVVADDTDDDDDDDGLRDDDESTAQVLPNQSPDGGITPPAKPNPEQWTNGDVHQYYAYGKSNPLSPDSDGDFLPDGLEVGWRSASNPPTDPTTDTDGDGYPNFIGDLDPPFFNTLDNEGNVPGVNSAAEGGDRAKRLVGTVTDPTNPDSDGDGILDGIEDANRNGWVDGDGDPIDPTFDPWLDRNWPNGVINPGETWTETDPNNRDTDGDELTDGYGEDTNFDGVIEGDTNGDRVYDAGETWTETDPLNADTDGDGLPDGWEVNQGLDPLDNGTDNLATADGNDGNPENGAAGDPDEDGFSNAQELVNNTRPLEDDNLPPPPANSIVIGPGETETFGVLTHQNEFTDWTVDDLLVLDEYQGSGTNNQGGDVYRGWDGFDLSRDMVAFYFRDGGGDGKLYFRVDFHDLTALAEEGHLDIYVVIDTGNTAVGESSLPDDIDTRTNMKWEAVIAVYQSNNGAVYVDLDSANNSTAIGEDLFSKGVVRRESTPNGFGLAYFNSELDSAEFSISRDALLDAGWNGNAENLNFQVYTTKDGTSNSPVGGGDIGGRSDIRDTIYDDWLASDYWRDQGTIGGAGSVLSSWFSRSGANDRGKRAKVAMLAHGNQAIKPGSEIQDLINNGQGTGYFRLVDAHGAFAAPLNLHITATLASAIQWAAVDPAAGKPWRDGPSLNTALAGLMADGVVSMLGTTFADHILPFATDAFTADNVSLAHDTLTRIYGVSPSTVVFWTPERVADDGVLDTIGTMGFTHTVVDQMRHVFKWFGRNSALGEAGYRQNRVNNLNLFVLNDFASGFRFQNHDNGLNFPLRELLSRRARSGTQDQLLILASDWEDFLSGEQSDAYDKNLRWLMNRPWIELVKLEDVATGGVDLSQPADGAGDTWGWVDHGTGQTLEMSAKDWIDHATQEDYTNWYDGQPGREQGLSGVTFDIRTSVPTPAAFGRLGFGGIVESAWQQVNAIPDGNSGPGRLGRASMGAGMFITAFHQQQNNDLSTFSTGEYIYPDTDYNELAVFARRAQAAVRHSALYRQVDLWAAAPPVGTVSLAQDVDLDGENEYLLYNQTVFAVFEAQGGRLVAAFARNQNSGNIFQVIGTQPAFPGRDTEDQGASSVTGTSVNAHRTAGFTDWFANGSGGETSQYVNEVYTVAANGTDGWTFTSPNGDVAKTISLGESSASLAAAYTLTGGVNKLYVRTGLSPDLDSLMVYGQKHLVFSHDATDGRVALTHAGTEPVSALLRYAPATATYNAAAVDDDPGGGTEFDTMNMRNQALTQQIEMENVDGQTSFTLELALETGATDDDEDGLPNWWEDANGLDRNDDGTGDPDNGADGDIDGDTVSNIQEYVTGMNSTLDDRNTYPRVAAVPEVNGNFKIQFPVLTGRSYRIWYVDDLNGTWQDAGSFSPTQDNPAYTWTDDGSFTFPNPTTVNHRFYYIEITRP